MAIEQYIAAQVDATPVATNKNDSGLWLKTTGNGLEQLAEKLPTATATDIRSREDLTVPTPWSSVTSFDILLDSAVRAHKALIGGAKAGLKIEYGEVQDQAELDWRVLITLIALRKERRIPISFKTIDISNSTDQFCREISKQLPTKSVFKDNDRAWGKITLILLSGDVIGVLTPSNLVCSRYYYSDDENDNSVDIVPNAVQWLCENRLMNKKNKNTMNKKNKDTELYEFVDPINSYISQDKNSQPHPESVAYILAWLNKIKATITSPPFIGKGSTLDTLIDAFISDINLNTDTPAKVPTLNSIVSPNAIYTAEDLVNNIQGQYSLLGVFTTIAYSNCSDYDIDYIPVDDGSPYKKYFNSAIFANGAVTAIVLVKKDSLGNLIGEPYCLGALSRNFLVTVSNNAGESNVLIENGLMNAGAEYANPVEFATENAERFVYMNEWMDKISVALAKQFPAQSYAICNELASFVDAIKSRFSARFAAGTNEAIRVKNYKNNGFVTVIPGGGTIDAIFRNLAIQIDTVKTGIADNVTIKKTTQMVFSEQAVGKELMAFYLRKQRGDANITITTPPQKDIFDTSTIFNYKIYYVGMTGYAYKNKQWRFGNASTWNIEQAGGKGGPHYAVLWPINPTVLTKLSAEDILSNLSSRYNKNKDECCVTLTCQLAGGGTSTVSKKYTGPFTMNMADHDTIDQSDIPGLSVWPYVKNNGWYAIYRSENLDNGKQRCDAVIMPDDANQEYNDWNQISDANFKRQLIYRKHMPEYAEIHNDVGKNIGWIGFDVPATDIGVAAKAANIMKVGLDFGTSSTAVYAKIGPSNPEFVDFSAVEAYTPIKHANDDMNIYFIPNEYSDKNFYPSILRLSSNSNASSRMLDLGNAVYKYEYEKDSAIAGGSEVISEMKWDGTNNKKVYLTQIIMQVIMWGKLKGATKINWQASYPSAFSNNMKFKYENILNQIIEDSAKNLGVTSIDNSGNIIPAGEPIINLQTESIASATYLMNGVGAKNMIIIDIGGGSTDISLWDSTGAIVQSSFNIASRRIFLEPLIGFVKANKNMQTCIGNIKVNDKTPFADIIGYINKNNDAKLGRLIEQALLNHHQDIISQMKALPANDPDRVKFEEKIIAGFFAILYFTLETVKSGLVGNQVGVDISLVGNGAKIYNWILGGYINNINTYLKNRMCQIANLDIFNAITPVNNVTAKTEAAQGLLMNNGKTGAIGPSVLAGINMVLTYTVNGVQQAPYKIGANDFFYDANSNPNTDPVKLCLNAKNGHKAQACSVDLNSIQVHYNKFKEIVEKAIFKDGFQLPDLDNTKAVAVKAKVDGMMLSAFNQGLIQSPLLCVLVEAI